MDILAKIELKIWHDLHFVTHSLSQTSRELWRQQMDCRDRSPNVWTCMQYIWIFGSLVEIGVEMKFGQKTACPDMLTFFQILSKKSQILRFGGDLAEVWNIQIFGYLNIWTDRQIMAWGMVFQMSSPARASPETKRTTHRRTTITNIMTYHDHDIGQQATGHTI